MIIKFDDYSKAMIAGILSTVSYLSLSFILGFEISIFISIFIFVLFFCATYVGKGSNNS
jgi:hypothetical protein